MEFSDYCLFSYANLRNFVHFSPQFHMRKEQSCTVSCHQILDAEAAKNFKEKIDDEYRVNM